MQLAIVNNQRVEAFLGGKGECPICGSAMIAKCGQRIIHHWAHRGRIGGASGAHRGRIGGASGAHRGRRQCDPWWENETLWHRDWKNHFPEDCREVSHTAHDGEIHRADIRTPTGIYIEIQHSGMSDEERLSRERFYKNLVWVVDGRGFCKNFDIYHPLPHPGSELAEDLVWQKARRYMHGANDGGFFRLSEAREEDPEITKESFGRDGKLREVHSIRKIEKEMQASPSDYYQYDWVRPRKTWLEATCPVYIDFGDDFLFKLCVYDSSGLRCVRIISKEKFLHDVMVETQTKGIAESALEIP